MGNEKLKAVDNTPAAPVAFKVKKNLTPPVLKLIEGEAAYVKITAAMYIGRDIKSKNPADKQKEPAHILDCVNLVTGEVCQVIAAAIIQSTLTENYPNDTYVGKGFSITKQARQPGKQYNKYEVCELEL